jgi:hypothetical protein
LELRETQAALVVHALILQEVVTKWQTSETIMTHKKKAQFQIFTPHALKSRVDIY